MGGGLFSQVDGGGSSRIVHIACCVLWYHHRRFNLVKMSIQHVTFAL